jgi:hypothetical protein
MMTIVTSNIKGTKIVGLLIQFLNLSAFQQQ